MRVKDIPGFEGYYIVADTGYVIATYRQFTDSMGRLTSRPAKALRPINEKKGYRQVALCKNGQITIEQVHRLVAAAFCPPYDGEQVNHIDGDKKNNHYSNLEWCTAQGNTLHYHLRSKRIELTGREIDEIIELGGKLSQVAIARRFNITPLLVYRLLSSRERNKRGRKDNETTN